MAHPADQPTIIIGGGIIGICAAYFLARRGAPVVLFGDAHVADSASTGNAGLISLGHPPLPRPGLAVSALKWMLDPGSPLYIPPRLDFTLMRWLWQFHRACGRAHYERSVRILAEHGRPAGACIAELIAEESIDCGYAPIGQMSVYRTSAGLEHGREEANRLVALGYEVRMISGDELREETPAYRPEVAGAAVYQDSGFASPGTFVAEMLDRANRHGAELRTDDPVASLVVDNGRCVGVRTASGEVMEAGAVVLAAGIWSTVLARTAGIRIPMQPAKGYHVDLTGGPTLELAGVLAESFVACTPMEGRLRLAGTLELSGINERIVQKRVDMLLVGARRYLDGIDGAEVGAPWCGLRPCTADGLPVIGWAPPVDRLFIATGHAMMGFTLGPLAGRIAAENVLDGSSPSDVSAFRVDRFR